MILLMIFGAILITLGLGGLTYCVREAVRIRKGGLPPEEAHAHLQKLVAVNLGSVAIAAMGLAFLLAGFLL